MPLARRTDQERFDTVQVGLLRLVFQHQEEEGICQLVELGGGHGLQGRAIPNELLDRHLPPAVDRQAEDQSRESPRQLSRRRHHTPPRAPGSPR